MKNPPTPWSPKAKGKARGEAVHRRLLGSPFTNQGPSNCPVTRVLNNTACKRGEGKTSLNPG